MKHSPIFILSCARSGSTLLRLAMDTHPEIASPPELHLLQLAQRLLWTCRITLEDTDHSAPFSAAIPATRTILDDIMSDYLVRADKPCWCEKSVTTINHMDILQEVYPEARLIVLYRHAADVVASSLRAIADRPEGYDFEPYLAADPHRTQALLRYWMDKTTALLEAERIDGFESRVRVRYEDLVRETDGTLAHIADALELDPPAGWTEQIWQTPHQHGPGDASAYSSSMISRDSLGRGVELAWDGVSRNLIKRANGLLAQLGYATLQSEER